MDNYDRSQVLDLSSFLLVEFSDDSEADLDSSMIAAFNEEGQEDNDDAQSCCNDLSGCGSNPDDDETALVRRDGYDFQYCDIVERPWEEDTEEEGVVNMCVKRRGSESKTCIQGRGRYQQPLNEIEKNKIFWETCLASGSGFYQSVTISINCN